MNKSKTKTARILILLGITSLIYAGCGDNSTDSDSDDFNVQTISDPSHGDVLADGEGNILYFFTPDVQGESTCEGECITNWPAFDVGEIMPEEGLEASDFGSIDRPDGSSQTTYKGWPLYYFINDEQPGDINGDGVQNVWYVAKPGNSLMVASGQLTGEDGENYIIDENGDYVAGEGSTTYFTDAEGRTLYTFVIDSANTNNFTEEDFSNNDVWPVYHTEIESLPSGMDEGDFGEITVHDQEQQLTYKGWPVYYFGQDTERGDTQGVSFPQPGVWPVINNDTPDAPGYTSESSNNDNNGDDEGGDPRY